MIGSTVGNYRIVRELGSGGMGAVYEGVDVMVERRVAIKVLRAEIARQPELIERFRSEAVTLARLNHPCIATLYSFFRERDEFYMVMEFVAGNTLETVLKESGRIPPGPAVEIMRQALDGMAHAHSMGVLHRDIKPANIMFTRDGKVKVTDFGIARVLGTSRMTREGRIIGTLEYIAPERIRGEEADIRSDLYSAGIVLFEALSGRLPFVSETDFGLLQAHLNLPPPSLAELGVDCPAEVEQILRMALAKNPAERFQSAEAMRNALAGVAMASSPPAAPAQRKAPLKWVAVAAAGVLLLLAVAAVWYRLASRPGTAQTQPAGTPPPAVQTAPPPPPAQLPPELRPEADSPGVKLSPGQASTLSELPAAEETAKKPASDREEKRKAALRALEGGEQGSEDAKRKAALRALEK